MADKKREITKAEAGKEVVAGIKAGKEAKVTKTRVKLSAPPAPPAKLGEVVNPIIAQKSLKRALTAAIVKVCTHVRDGKSTVDEEKAGLMVRTSGILFKAGYTPEKETEKLVQSEWSGRPYVRFITNTADGKVYMTKHEDKVKLCMPFAKELKSAVDAELAKTPEPKKEEVAIPAAV